MHRARISLGRAGRVLVCLSLLITGCTTVARAAEPHISGWVMEQSQQERQAVTTLLRAGQYAELDRRYGAFQLQYEQAKINDRDLTLEYQAFYDTAPENEQYLSQWIASNPKSYPALVARGIYYQP
jgi:hypothetical protein